MKKSFKVPLLLIVGQSGVGKSAIVKASDLTEVISHTTREPRPGEKNGVDYFFITKTEMDKLEATIDPPKNNYDNWYCACDHELDSKDCLVVDIESAIEIRKLVPSSKIVWIDGVQREIRGDYRVEPKRRRYLYNFDYIIKNDQTLDYAVDRLHWVRKKSISQHILLELEK